MSSKGFTLRVPRQELACGGKRGSVQNFNLERGRLDVTLDTRPLRRREQLSLQYCLGL